MKKFRRRLTTKAENLHSRIGAPQVDLFRHGRWYTDQVTIVLLNTITSRDKVRTADRTVASDSHLFNQSIRHTVWKLSLDGLPDFASAILRIGVRAKKFGLAAAAGFA